MPAALPFIGAGLGALSTIEGANAQGQQNQINQQQLDAAIQQQKLGRLLGQTGAVGNPFSQSYAPIFQQMAGPQGGNFGAASPQQQAILRQMGVLK